MQRNRTNSDFRECLLSKFWLFCRCCSLSDQRTFISQLGARAQSTAGGRRPSRRRVAFHHLGWWLLCYVEHSRPRRTQVHTDISFLLIMVKNKMDVTCIRSETNITAVCLLFLVARWSMLCHWSRSYSTWRPFQTWPTMACVESGSGAAVD